MVRSAMVFVKRLDAPINALVADEDAIRTGDHAAVAHRPFPPAERTGGVVGPGVFNLNDRIRLGVLHLHQPTLPRVRCTPPYRDRRFAYESTISRNLKQDATFPFTRPQACMNA